MKSITKMMLNIDNYFSLSTSLNLALEILPMKNVDSKKQSAVPPLQCVKDSAASADFHVSRRL